MHLTATTHAIELVTSSAEGIEWSASYGDHAAPSGTFTPGSSQGSIAAATTTQVVAPPAADTQRQVKELLVRNTGSAVNTVTVQKDVAGTKYRLGASVPLLSGQSLRYRGRGRGGRPWSVLDRDGREVRRGVVSTPGSFMFQSPFFVPASSSGARTLASGVSFCLWIGKAPKDLAAGAVVSVRYHVTTLSSTITWAEMGVAKGQPNGSAATVVVCGAVSIAGDVTTTGRKTANITLTHPIAAGEDMWTMIGSVAAVMAAVRTQQADDLQAGYTGNISGQPSLLIGVPALISIESASTNTAWLTLFC